MYISLHSLYIYIHVVRYIYTSTRWWSLPTTHLQPPRQPWASYQSYLTDSESTSIHDMHSIRILELIISYERCSNVDTSHLINVMYLRAALIPHSSNYGGQLFRIRKRNRKVSTRERKAVHQQRTPYFSSIRTLRTPFFFFFFFFCSYSYVVV